MSFNLDSSGDESEVMSGINTTPLVDIMLVLLIIFLLTIPVVIHVIPVELPKDVNEPYEARAENINLTVDKAGLVYWNTTEIPTMRILVYKLKAVAALKPQPELHIRGDEEARYENIGKVIFAAKRAGITKVGFIIQPPVRELF